MEKRWRSILYEKKEKKEKKKGRMCRKHMRTDRKPKSNSSNAYLHLTSHNRHMDARLSGWDINGPIIDVEKMEKYFGMGKKRGGKNVQKTHENR